MREGPERVPAQNFLVLLTLGMKLLLVLGITAILDLGAKETPLGLVTQMVVGAAVTAALVALFLTLRNLPHRLPATVAALFGSDLILTGLFALLLILLTKFAIDPALVGQLFSLWSTIVAGFIMHKAMDTIFLIGFGVGMFILLVSLSVAAQT